MTRSTKPGAAEARANKSASVRTTSIPWRERPLVSLQDAATISGLSTGSLYRAEADGRLEFRRLGGRTLIPTASLVAFIEGAAPYEPLRDRTRPANARRSELAREAAEQ